MSLENIVNLIYEKSREAYVVKYLYELLIMSTGVYLVFTFSVSGFVVPQDIYAILAWLVLIIALPIPIKAQSNIHPFEELEKNKDLICES